MRNEHTLQEEMGVPGSLVGLIIGRGGENLKRIERETGCRVQFSQGKKPCLKTWSFKNDGRV